MKWEITDKTLESEFVSKIEELSGQDISSCYQCGCCSAGCPICHDMDYSPNQIIRLIQLGLGEQVLSSNSIWMCASCQTCTTRCPLNVDLAKVMDALRLVCHEQDQKKSFDTMTFFKDLTKRTGAGIAKTLQMDIRSNIIVFSQAFLKSIRDYGRMSEMNLIANYNINSGNLFSSVANAPAFILKGKLGLSRGDANRIAKVTRIFEKVEEIEGKIL